MPAHKGRGAREGNGVTSTSGCAHRAPPILYIMTVFATCLDCCLGYDRGDRVSCCPAGALSPCWDSSLPGHRPGQAGTHPRIRPRPWGLVVCHLAQLQAFKTRPRWITGHLGIRPSRYRAMNGPNASKTPGPGAYVLLVTILSNCVPWFLLRRASGISSLY